MARCGSLTIPGITIFWPLGGATSCMDASYQDIQLHFLMTSVCTGYATKMIALAEQQLGKKGSYKITGKTT